MNIGYIYRFLGFEIVKNSMEKNLWSKFLKLNLYDPRFFAYPLSLIPPPTEISASINKTRGQKAPSYHYFSAEATSFSFQNSGSIEKGLDVILVNIVNVII